MASITSPYAGLYEKGIAAGHSNVKDDTITMRFKDEIFTLPAMVALGAVHYNGYFYVGEVEKLRELQKRNG